MRLNRRLSRKVSVLLTILVPVAFVLLWQLSVTKGWITATVIPAPTTLWQNFLTMINNGRLASGLSISFFRVITGFLIGAGAGLIIGFIMGLVPEINQGLSVLVNILRPIPPIALVPLFIVTMGIGEQTNVAVIIFGSFWSVLLNTITGVRSVDQKLLNLAYVYRVPKVKVIFGIILPSAVTSIITGIRLGMGTAWMSIVGAEMIGASSGIGYMIMYAREMAQAANMYVCVLVIGIVGFLIDRILLQIQKIFDRKFRGLED